MSKTVKTFVSVGAVVAIVLTTIGISYSHLTENLSGGSGYVSEINTKNGKIEAAFSGGNTIEISKVSAGSEEVYAKTFSVKGTNINENNLNYRLNLVIDENTYSNMSFSLTGYNPISNGVILPNINNYALKLGPNNIPLGNGYFVNANSVVHTFTIKFYLNANESGKLKAHIEALEG